MKDKPLIGGLLNFAIGETVIFSLIVTLLLASDYYYGLSQNITAGILIIFIICLIIFIIFKAIIANIIGKTYKRLVNSLNENDRRLEEIVKQRGLALLEAKKLSSVVENTFEAIALLDLGKTNLITYVNPAWERLFGYTSAEVVNKRVGLLIDAAKRDPQKTGKLLWSCVKTGQIFYAEMIWRKKTGELFWADVHSVPLRDEQGKIYVWCNTIRDISEQKNYEKNILREKTISESLASDLEKFKMAVDGVSDHVIITDVDGLILYANHAVEEITGYSPAEVIGKKPGALWGGHMPKEFYIKMWKIIKDDKKIFKDEVTNRRKNGASYIAAVSITPIFNKNKQVQFYVGLERDITKAKEIDKMKSEFVSLASHQLRTPLSAIKWIIELLEGDKKNPLNRQQAGLVKDVKESNERMILLVDDMLNVSRINTGRKFDIVLAKTDLTPILKLAVKEQGLIARQNNIKILITKDTPKNLIAFADGAKLRQAFVNLINNAIKYSPPKSKITVGINTVNKQIIFTVKDSGIGIPVGAQHRIFERFFRADNATKFNTESTGLGLYIVKAIAEGHGGKVWFESAENKGSTFYFSLPI